MKLTGFNSEADLDVPMKSNKSVSTAKARPARGDILPVSAVLLPLETEW